MIIEYVGDQRSEPSLSSQSLQKQHRRRRERVRSPGVRRAASQFRVEASERWDVTRHQRPVQPQRIEPSPFLRRPGRIPLGEP